MRWWTKKAFVAFSAVLGVLVYSMQFKKSCEDATPYACVMSLVSWVGHGMLTPRDVATKSPPQKLPPEAIKKAAVADTPKASPKLSLATGIGPAVTNDGRDRRVAVVNAGNVILESVFATSCASRNWGRDILGDKMIQVGQNLTLNIDDGSGACCFDLRAKFQNGVQRTNMGVNVCDVSRWTVDNR
jgi:hypothetical protein